MKRILSQKFIDRKIFYKLYDNKLKTLSCHMKWVHVHMYTMYFHIDNLYTNVNPLLTKSINLNPWKDLKGVKPYCFSVYFNSYEIAVH